jgi:polysaccharide pyruvyl transferase WcaK-like protein
MDFFTAESTKKLLLAGKGKIVILVGGFTGYLNFGDVIQLQGAVDIHRKANEECVILPVIHPSAFQGSLDPVLLEELYSVTGWLFYAKTGSEQKMFQSEFLQSQVQVDLKAVSGKVLVHFYGSGRLNAFWGKDTLRLLEEVLSATTRAEYIISGQQVSPGFVKVFQEHLDRWKPSLIGCRDESSIKSLRSLGIPAKLSGDDAFEVLSEHSRSVTEKDPGEYSVGLSIRQTEFTGNDKIQTTLPEGMINQLRRLKGIISPHDSVLAIRTFGYSRDQGISIEEFLELECQLSVGSEIDLVAALVENRFSGLTSMLQNLRCAVVMSYHLALFLQILQVPVYLIGLNEYYAQKQAGLGQSGSLSQFITALESRSPLGRVWVKRQAEIRQDWLSALGKHL